MFLLNKQPLQMTLLILFMVLSLAPQLHALAIVHWASYMILMVYLGGLLVLFLYLTSLVSSFFYSANKSALAVGACLFGLLGVSQHSSKTGSHSANKISSYSVFSFSSSVSLLAAIFFLMSLMLYLISMLSKLSAPMRQM